MKSSLGTWFIIIWSAGGILPSAAGSESAGGPPNIVFILADDQGWSDLSFPMDPAVPEGGASFFHTPNLSRLAREGMRFPSGYASAPLCTPTRRSIQFGMTPARQRGTEFLGQFSPRGHLSIPQAIRRANPLYRCAHFGKWGAVMSGVWKEHPEILGFDESEPDMEASPAAMGYDESDGVTCNPDGTFHNWRLRPKDAPRNFVCEPDSDAKRTFSVTQRSIEFMERQVKAGRRFYLQVSYYAIHTAFQARPATLARYADREQPPRQVLPGIAPMLDDLDAGVGQLLSAIDQLGLRENTYVFFSSDNGGEPGRIASPEFRALSPRNHPLRSAKQFLYEGGIRVPFIVRGPGVEAGSVCREPVVQYDLLPTFYALAGGRAPLPEEIDGGNLQPLLDNPAGGAVKRPSPGLVFHRPLHRTQPHSALRIGDFKLVLTWSGAWQVANRELFNLAKDIGEQNNLAVEMPVKAAEMARALIDYLTSVDAEAAVSPPSHPR
jgi:arylsulfatase A